MPKKVLILTADAGSGHRNAAIAVNHALTELYGNELEIKVTNPLDGTKAPAFLKDSQKDYDKWVQNVPELYKFGYDVSDGLVSKTIMESVLIVSLYGVMQNLIEIEQPDVIVTTFPLYQAPVHAALAIRHYHIPVISILTDLATVHQIWFNSEVDIYIVPNEIVKKLAIKSGVTKNKIHVIGIPIDPEISKNTKNKQELRKKLNLLENKITIFAVGSKREENLLESLNMLNHSGFDIQLIVSAGNDKSLLQELKDVDWHIDTKIFEYIEDMPEYLLASDLIISKAGGLIVTEALACGLPIIMVSVIQGQETGNANYVIEGDAGFSVDNPIQFLEKISNLLIHDNEKLFEMQKNALKLGNANAAYDISKIIRNTVYAKRYHDENHMNFRSKIVNLLSQNQIEVDK
jgi:1,2-diacylglycerol 3-beta-galactosyltransferase